jgi:hypothetical protein
MMGWLVGSNRLWAEATDMYGNVRVQGPYTLNVTEQPIAGLAATNDGPRDVGQAITFTATITAGENVSYNWAFGDGGTATGAVAQHTYLQAGSFSASVTAANQVSSFTTSTTVQVLARTSLALQVTPGTTTYGRTAFFTATVTALDGYSAGPGGTVTFREEGNVLTTATVNGARQATWSSNSFAVGTHGITATYSGDLHYDGSVAAGATLTVTQATLVVRAEDKSKVYGAVLPTLTVTYTGFVLGDDAGDLTGQPISSTTAETLSPAGTYPITVTGTLSSPSYVFQYVDGTLTVEPVGTSTTLTLDPVASTHGQTVTLTARVIAASGVPVTGTITFLRLDVLSTLGTAPLVDGVATLSTDHLPAGNLSLKASYGAEHNFQASLSAAAALAVSKAPLGVRAEDKSKLYGEVSPTLSVTYTGFVLGEDASVLRGAPSLNTEATTLSGVGTYPIMVGLGTLSAANYAFNFTNGTLTIAPVGTSTAITITPNPVVWSQPVTMTASVTSASGALVTGTVALVQDDGTLLYSGPLAGGLVSFTTTLLPVGTYTITATYLGGPNFYSSTSAISQTVAPTLFVQKIDAWDETSNRDLVYTITVGTTGTVPLLGVVVTDTVPAYAKVPKVPAGAVENRTARSPGGSRRSRPVGW